MSDARCRMLVKPTCESWNIRGICEREVGQCNHLTLELAQGCTITNVNTPAIQIGAVAALAGVSVDTVRYYERLKLLPRAPRTKGAFRIFPPETVDRITFIKRAQEMGLNLEEIGQLLLTRGGANECREISARLEIKLAELTERVRKIQEFRLTLKRQLAACRREIAAHGDAANCPVLIIPVKRT